MLAAIAGETCIGDSILGLNSTTSELNSTMLANVTENACAGLNSTTEVIYTVMVMFVMMVMVVMVGIIIPLQHLQ